MKIKFDFITNSSSTNYITYHVTVPKNFDINNHISPSERMKFFGDSLQKANPTIAIQMFETLTKNKVLSFYGALHENPNNNYSEMRDTYHFIVKILRELGFIKLVDSDSDWEGILLK